MIAMTWDFFILFIPRFTLNFTFGSDLPGLAGQRTPKPPCSAAGAAVVGAALGSNSGYSRLLVHRPLPELGTETRFPTRQAGKDLLVVAVRAPELLIGTRVPAEAMKTARAVPSPANVIWLAAN